LGALGARVAKLGRAFGMKVLGFDPVAPAVEGVTPASVADILRHADVVSLHVPLTPATRHMIGAAELATMKKSALLVNTARGGLVDEGALVDALAAGRLGGVGLDVLSVEPPPADHPLTDARAPWSTRVVVTPHIGWGAVEARRRLAAIATENVRAYLAGQRLNRVD
jgi:glycerate dehydrogenase